ncbi:MAG: type II toxin-antitoxin system VapC family toxin [Candidatus Diapherotrites archaeon]|nr:type II toxin-antitoxin system VapC family toxin [Candidatus Diapherotrites archaeon]
MEVYLDTNVYLDYFLDREDKLVPWNEFAFSLLRKTRECEFTILVSDVVIRELAKVMAMSDGKVEMELSEVLGCKMVKVSSSRKQREEAAVISAKYKIPAADVLHSLIALEHGVAIVTRDKHFERLRGILSGLEMYNPREV